MAIYSARKPYLEFDLIEDNEVLNEGMVFKFVKKNEVPDDFKKFAMKFVEDAQKIAGSKVGYGLLSATFGFKFKDVKSKIEKKEKKNIYAISLDLKSVLKGLDVEPTLKNRLTATDSIFTAFVDKVCKAQGMKRASSKPGSSASYIKKGKNCIYNVDGAYIPESGCLQICIRCLKDTEDNMNLIVGGESFRESVSISSNDDSYFKEENTVDLKGLTPEELYGFSPDLGMARSEDLSNSDYSNFFRNPEVKKAFTEHLDLTDDLTRKSVIAMNEAEQGSVLTALTSKLYDNTVSKVDDIDFGEIPMTKGDITKLSNYDRMNECVEILVGILKEFKQDTSCVDEISKAISNVSTRKDMFMKGFKYNCELVIIMYNTTVLSIISAISYMIATAIEFIKTPNQESFQIVLDKVAYSKTKNNMLYNNLKKFNKSCDSKDFDKAMNHIVDNRLKGIAESYGDYREAAAIGTGIAIITGVLVILTNIIPILREMVFFFYYTRMRVSDFFDIQADLLQMNAYNLQNNANASDEDKEKIVSKQLKISALFRKIANKISFTVKKAESDSTKEMTKDSKKIKMEEITDEIPDSVSALF